MSCRGEADLAGHGSVLEPRDCFIDEASVAFWGTLALEIVLGNRLFMHEDQ